MSILATSRPEGGSRPGGPPASVRYEVNPAWPGIPASHPLDWCNDCTRAWYGGRYVVKHLNVMCDTHRRWRP